MTAQKEPSWFDSYEIKGLRSTQLKRLPLLVRGCDGAQHATMIADLLIKRDSKPLVPRAKFIHGSCDGTCAHSESTANIRFMVLKEAAS